MQDKKIFEEKKTWIYPLFGLILIWLIFLVRIFDGQTALGGLLEHDIGFQWIPFKEFTRFCYQNGYFPLWCPYIFAGMPFLAFSHTQMLYPFGFLLTFFDYAWAVNFYYPLHLSIGFLGLYLLLRNLGISALVSFIASLSTILSCKFFYFIHFLPSASSNFWGIWFFYFLVKLKQKGSWKYIFGLAIALFLELVGGDVESTAYQLFFTPFFVLVLQAKRQNFNPTIWIYFLLGTALGIFLASVQILPLYEYSGLFLRKNGLTFSAFEWRTLPAGLSLALILPIKNFSVPGLTSPAPYLYLGLIVLIFPFFALLEKRNFWFFLLAILVLLFSFGSLKPLDYIIWHIPFLNRYGAQEHAFFLFQIFWTILAGTGIEIALKKRFNFGYFYASAFFLVILQANFLDILKKLPVNLNKYFFQAIEKNSFDAFVQKALLVVLGLFIIFRVFKKIRSSKIMIPASILVIFLLDTYLPAFIYLPKNDPRDYQPPVELLELKKFVQKKPARCVAISIAGVNDPKLLHHLGLRTHCSTIDGWISTPPFSYAKFLNLLDERSAHFKDDKLDYLGFNVHFRDGEFIRAETLPLIDLLSLKYFLVRGVNLKFASPFVFRSPESLENSGRSLILPPSSYFSQRVYSEKGDIFKSEILPEGKRTFFQLAFQNSQASSLLYARTLLRPENQQEPKSLKISFPLKKAWGKLGNFIFFNLTISSEQKKLKLLEPKIENPQKRIQRIWSNEIEIYENQKAFPQAFIVHNCEVFEEDEQVLVRLKNSYRWELERKIYLLSTSPTARIIQKVAKELKNKGIDPLELKEPVYLKTELPDRMVFLVRLARPGYLFLNHQYLPGWKVFVNGREWKMERANYCFRAVFLDKGTHRVEFRYQPVGFAIGLYFGFASFLVQLIFLVLWIKKDRGKIRGL